LTARKVDPMRSTIFDRFYSQALMAIEGQPAERSAVMLTRASILFEVAADMTGWPGTVRAVTKEPQRRPRSAAGRIARSTVAHGM
jgi:hypothetical protein